VFGGSDLPITAVTIALPTNGSAGVGSVQASTIKKVTFSGNDSIIVPNGALVISDPIDFKVKAQTNIAVTMYLKTGQTTNSITGHPGSRTTSWYAPGNQVNAANLTKADSSAHWYVLSLYQH
jgi:hypothetical protein